MKLRARSWVVVPLLAGALIAASCAEEREKEVRAVAVQYLTYEKYRDYLHQSEMWDQKAAISLPPPIGTTMPNPFLPRELVSFTVGIIKIDGPAAQANVDAVFRMTWGAGYTTPDEHHKITVYMLRESNQWVVDEIKTRTLELDEVSGKGAGNMWLMQRTQGRGTPGR